MASYFIKRPNRAQRRRLAAASAAVDRVTAGDAAFFTRFPHRQHRLRPMSAAEFEQFIAMGATDTAGPDERWGVAVRQVAPGARMRRPFTCKRDADLLDAPEAVATATWRQAAANDPRGSAIEAQVRAVMTATGSKR